MARVWIGLLLLGLPVWAQDEDDDDTVIEIEEPVKKGEDAPRRQTPPATTPPGKKDPKPKKETPDAPTGPREFEDAKKLFKVKLPDGWEARRRDMDKTALALDLKIPGSTAWSLFRLRQRPDLGHPRGAPFRYRDGALRDLKGRRTTIGQDPLPHLVVEGRDKDREVATIFAFLRIRGNGLVIQLDTDKTAYAAMGDALFGMVAALECRLEPWPQVPKGYAVSKKGPFVFAKNPRVQASLAPLQNAARAQFKRFTKTHGALPKGVQPLIYVHNDRSEARPILAAAANHQYDNYADIAAPRMFTKAFHKNDIEAEALFAASLQGLLLQIKYGRRAPLWWWNGERTVARAEVRTGKKLPYLFEGFANWRDETEYVPLPRLKRPAGSKGNDQASQSYSIQCFFNVAFLRSGPRKHRQAYRAFLAELAATADAEAALRNHIEPLGYDEIPKELYKTIWKFRIVKAR